MGLFKEAAIKKNIEHVNQGNMSLSYLTQWLNQEVYKYQARHGKLVTMMDVVRTLEAFLVHNDPVKSETELKIKTLIDYMKTQVITDAKRIYNDL